MAAKGPPALGDPWTPLAQTGAGGGGRAGPPYAVRAVGGLGGSVVAASGGAARAAAQDTAAASAAAAAAAAGDASAAAASVNGASYGIRSLALDDSLSAGRSSPAEPPRSPPPYLSPSSAQVPRRNLPPPPLPPPPQVSASISGPCLSHFLADLSLTDGNARSWDSPPSRSRHLQQDGLQERAREHQGASTSLAGATGDSEGLLFGSVSFDKIAQVLQDDVPTASSSSSRFLDDSMAGLRSDAGGSMESVRISVVIQQFHTALGGMATDSRSEKAVQGALHEARVPTAAAAQTERDAASPAAAGSGRLFDAAGAVDRKAVSSLLAFVASELDGGSPGPSGKRERFESLDGSLRDAGPHAGSDSLRDRGNTREPHGQRESSEENETRAPAPTSSVVGWFVRRRKSPVRPSMREVAATASLHRWLRHQRLREQAGAGNQGQGGGMVRPQPLLLLIASSTSSAAATSSPGQPGPIHSYDYQLYMFDPYWRARQRAAFAAAAALADGGGPGSAGLPSHSPLCAIPLRIANLGSLMRPHYDALPSLSLLPLAPFVSMHALVPGRALHPPAAASAGAAQGTAAASAATSSGWQVGLAAAGSLGMQQVEGLQAIYHSLLQQLNLLAEELATVEASPAGGVERPG